MRDIHLLTKETLYRLVELHSFFDVGDLLRNCTRIEVKDKELAHHLLYELLEEGCSLRFLLEDFLEILLDILLRLLPKVNTGSIAICLHFHMVVYHRTLTIHRALTPDMKDRSLSFSSSYNLFRRQNLLHFLLRLLRRHHLVQFGLVPLNVMFDLLLLLRKT